jgi:hypothetical protein
MAARCAVPVLLTLRLRSCLLAKLWFSRAVSVRFAYSFFAVLSERERGRFFFCFSQDCQERERGVSVFLFISGPSNTPIASQGVEAFRLENM